MGMPQDMSLVMARSLRPPLRKFCVYALTFCLQYFLSSRNSRRGFSKADSFRKNWVEDLTSGLVPQRVQWGSMTSPGTKVVPQLSHWSERTSCMPQLGHVPSTYLSGRNFLHFGQ